MDSYTQVLNQNKAEILDLIIDVLFGGSSDKLKLLGDVLLKDGRVSDLIFWNNFQMFLKEGNFDVTILRKFSERLEEHGNKEGYGIAIIKAIDDVESDEKARCLANLTQSVINSEITVEDYFRVIHTSKQLIREDLEFLSRSITAETFLDNEYLDDYLVNGLIKQVDGGYVYTDRAWDIVEHGICKGHKVNRPNKIKEREVFSIGGGVYDFGDEDEI